MQYEVKNSALKINKGIEPPPSVNTIAIERLKKNRHKRLSVNYYIDGILSGNRVILSQAITIIESVLVKHQQIARQIVDHCLPHSGNAYRIGITGVPGVGKSTFIEVFGSFITTFGRKIAVLAIDPSSERSGGSILGDKTRMENLSNNPHAFIRPSPSSGSLGGVANKTRETIVLCEAAGFDTIIVETVGVGQSETVVHSMVDFFLLLMLAGAGDELQGIKRGIMEMAEAITITKADGSNLLKAQLARLEYENALHLFPPTDSGWIPKVLTCSSRGNDGVEEVWKLIDSYFVDHKEYIEHKRRLQSRFWMYENINESLRNSFYSCDFLKNTLPEWENKVIEGKCSSYTAAQLLLDEYFGKISLNNRSFY